MKTVCSLLICLILLTSCIGKTDISMTDVDPQQWQSGHYAEVDYNNNDTTTLRTIDIVVRFNRNFNYNRLGLEICTITPQGYVWRDTVYITALEPENKHQTFYEAEQKYRGDVTFDKTGKYRFRISHVMPQKKINGINALGINIY